MEQYNKLYNNAALKSNNIILPKADKTQQQQAQKRLTFDPCLNKVNFLLQRAKAFS